MLLWHGNLWKVWHLWRLFFGLVDYIISNSMLSGQLFTFSEGMIRIKILHLSSNHILLQYNLTLLCWLVLLLFYFFTVCRISCITGRITIFCMNLIQVRFWSNLFIRLDTRLYFKSEMQKKKTNRHKKFRPDSDKI